jgi:peptidyl-prolyl cis-trans isomerase C
MRSLSLVVFRFLILGLCLVFFSSPVSAGKADKSAKDDKAVKAEKAVKVGKAVKTEPVEKKEAPKGNVAVVNGVAITQDDFDRELMGIEEQSANRGEKLDDARLSEIKKRILEKLIESELLYQESQKMGFKVEDAMVDEQFAKFKEQFPNDEEFNKELVKAKLSEASLKSQIKQVMTIQQLIDKEFIQKITVSEEELKTFYETHLKSRIEQNLKQEKIQTEVASYLDKLKEKANVERNLR